MGDPAPGPAAASSEAAGPVLALVGKSATLPPGLQVQAGGIVGNDAGPLDFAEMIVRDGAYIESKRKPYED